MDYYNSTCSKKLGVMKQIVTHGLYDHPKASHLDELIGVILETKESYRNRGMWTVLVLPACGGKAKRVTLKEKYLKPRKQSPPPCPSVIFHDFGQSHNEQTFGDAMGKFKPGLGVQVKDANSRYAGEKGILMGISRVTNTYTVRFFCDDNGTPAYHDGDGNIKVSGVYNTEGVQKDVAFGWGDLKRSGSWVKSNWNNPAAGAKVRMAACAVLDSSDANVKTQPAVKPGAIGTYVKATKMKGSWNTYTHTVQFEEAGEVSGIYSEQIELVE